MNLINIYKKSFYTVFANPAVTLFLILFLIASNFLSSYMVVARTKIVAMILFFCAFLLGLCFISGWLQIMKDVSEDEKAENKNYFAIFLEGIGRNIIPIGIGGFIYTLLITILFLITGKIAFHLFGSLDFILKDLANLVYDNNALMEYFSKLDVNQKYTIYSWQLSFIFASMIFNFIMLFYFPALIFDNSKNIFLRPLIALKNAICFLFKNFFTSILIYLSIYFTYMCLMILNALFSANVIISILLLLFYIYFISLAVMLTFNYYGQKNNSNNGCDSIREDENLDKPSKEL
ncbi:MAG: hypothetical protein IJW73_06720 [Candidatus Gastranaerophilales bacterium]|nr:hypothetical protein [Candidatus Gastranaerophilales bacterium]